jgi:hypothetical protein
LDKRYRRPWGNERHWQDERWRCWQIRGGGVSRGNVITSRTRGAREAEWEALTQHEERPCNSDERGWIGQKKQQPTMGGKGNGGWWL